MKSNSETLPTLMFVMKGSALNRGMNTGLENLAWGLAERGWPVKVMAGGHTPQIHHYSVPSGVRYHFTGEDTSPSAHLAAYQTIAAEHRLDVVIGWARFLLQIAEEKCDHP